MKKIYTLITGASAGIGRSFAFGCAKRNMNLVLVALPGKELDELAEELKKKFPIEVFSIGIDLTQPAISEKILNFCLENDITINMLINNAGMGSLGDFESHDLVFYERMIRLNILAAVCLTHAFLPMLHQQPKAYILNMGSSASFYSVPYKMIYAASKSFVYSFSRTLREELRGKQFNISVVCPGGVNTSEEVRERTEQAGWLAKKLILEPDWVAEEGIKGVLRNKVLILPGIVSKMYFILSRVVPYWLQLKIFKQLFKKRA